VALKPTAGLNKEERDRDDLRETHKERWLCRCSAGPHNTRRPAISWPMGRCAQDATLPVGRRGRGDEGEEGRLTGS